MDRPAPEMSDDGDDIFAPAGGYLPRTKVSVDDVSDDDEEMARQTARIVPTRH